jgi:hypothetical protein
LEDFGGEDFYPKWEDLHKLYKGVLEKVINRMKVLITRLLPNPSP